MPAQREQIDGIEQRALVGEHLRLGHQTVFFHLPGLRQGGVHTREQRIHTAQQPLRAQGTPVAVAHILQYVLRHFAAALLGHQELVGLLLGAVIGHPEIQRVPRKGQIGQGAVTLLRGGWAQRFHPVFDADGAASRVVVATGIARTRHQTGQHFVIGYIGQVFGQRVLQQLEAIVQVVLQRTGRSLVESDRSGHRLLVCVNGFAVCGDTVLDLFLGERDRRDGSASGQQQGQARESHQPHGIGAQPGAWGV